MLHELLCVVIGASAYQPIRPSATPFTRRSSTPVLKSLDPKRGVAALGFVGGTYGGALLWTELIANDILERKPLRELVADGTSLPLPDATSLQLPSVPDATAFKLPSDLSDQLKQRVAKLSQTIDSLSDQMEQRLVPPAGATEPSDVAMADTADVLSAPDLSGLADSLQQQAQGGLRGALSKIPPVPRLPSELKLPSDVKLPPAPRLLSDLKLSSDLKLPSFDADALASAKSSFLREAAALSSQLPPLPPPEDLAAISSAQLEAGATEAANAVGALTGDVLLPLIGGLIGAALLSALSEADNLLGLVLRGIGLLADLVLQVTVGITAPVVLGLLNVVFGAIVGAFFGAIVGPSTLVSSVADATKRDVQQKLTAAAAAPGKAVARLGELPAEIGRTVLRQENVLEQASPPPPVPVQAAPPLPVPLQAAPPPVAVPVPVQAAPPQGLSYAEYRSMQQDRVQAQEAPPPDTRTAQREAPEAGPAAVEGAADSKPSAAAAPVEE